MTIFWIFVGILGWFLIGYLSFHLAMWHDMTFESVDFENDEDLREDFAQINLMFMTWSGLFGFSGSVIAIVCSSISYWFTLLTKNSKVGSLRDINREICNKIYKGGSK